MSYETLNRTTNASVLKHTGKSWDQWVPLLKKAGGETWTHQELVAHLRKKHKLTPWWQQVVAGGFEVAVGKKIEGRTLQGDLTLTVTKTMPVSMKALWKFLNSEEGMKLWLKPLWPLKIKAGQSFETEDGYYGEIRTMKAPQRARLKWCEPNWAKPTVAQLYLVPRPGNKCLCIFSHEKVLETRVLERLRKRWKDAMDAIEAVVAKK